MIKTLITASYRFLRILKHDVIIKNFFKTSYRKNALLSYIIRPFKKKYANRRFTHTNFFEAFSWAKILSELGYNVDIINYDRTTPVEVGKYDIICGFGDVFHQYFDTPIDKKIITIYYGTGMHVSHQNHATLSRLRDVYNKKRYWIGKSTRYVEKIWTHQTFLVDAIIALGNDVCGNSFKQNYDGPVYCLPAPFYKIYDGYEIINNRSIDSKRSFLWFGSDGLVHKGLDILLDIFSTRDDIILHICGNIFREKDFVSIYKNELFNNDNIIIHGFVDIRSFDFKKILESCDFLIYPSCSEGGSPSVLNVVGNGGLIPILSKYTTVATGFEIPIFDLSVDGVFKAIDRALSLTEEEIINLRKENLRYVLENHSLETYYSNLKNMVQRIVSHFAVE